eukprot:2044481-Prymnesium_polylepis.2
MAPLWNGHAFACRVRIAAFSSAKERRDQDVSGGRRGGACKKKQAVAAASYRAGACSAADRPPGARVASSNAARPGPLGVHSLR